MKRRTRPHFENSTNSSIFKKAKYECIKWDSDVPLCLIDEEVLKASLQLYLQKTSISFYVGKTIAEFALGWIKMCPFCEIEEILILPSDLLMPTWVEECDNCSHRIYIYICDNRANHCNGYASCNWWLYWKSDTQTGLKFPYQNVCKICCKNHCSFHQDPELLLQICAECSFECSLCKNIFCNNLHIGYYCSICDSIYCEMCQDYSLSKGINSCINCFYDLQKYALYYPNLQDRLLFHHYFKLLFDNNHESLNLFIPSNIIHYIVAFINGNIINCSKQICKQDIPIVPPSINCFHEHSPYIENIVKCQSGHRNSIHMCDSCNKLCMVDQQSNVHYAMLEVMINNCPRLSSSITEIDHMIKGFELCEVCWVESGILTKLCHDCHLNCYDCSARICNSHFDLICESCGNIYCIQHWKTSKCQLCGYNICNECQIIKDQSGAYLFNCYNRYLVCSICFSSYIEEFAPSFLGYRRCLDIVQVIRDASKFGYIPFTLYDEQQLHIIDIIAVYACANDCMT